MELAIIVSAILLALSTLTYFYIRKFKSTWIPVFWEFIDVVWIFIAILTAFPALLLFDHNSKIDELKNLKEKLISANTEFRQSYTSNKIVCEMNNLKKALELMEGRDINLSQQWHTLCSHIKTLGTLYLIDFNKLKFDQNIITNDWPNTENLPSYFSSFRDKIPCKLGEAKYNFRKKSDYIYASDSDGCTGTVILPEDHIKLDNYFSIYINFDKSLIKAYMSIDGVTFRLISLKLYSLEDMEGLGYSKELAEEIRISSMSSGFMTAETTINYLRPVIYARHMDIKLEELKNSPIIIKWLVALTDRNLYLFIHILAVATILRFSRSIRGVYKAANSAK